ncbi:glucose-6-phosphate dehydrogenase [bacterium]|nr:MAG: glucose-6-phosphate dehydrogenase [bacterium]
MMPPPASVIIFGITGDLSRRYLLPSLYHLLAANLLPTPLIIVGVTRRDPNKQQIRHHLIERLQATGQTVEPQLVNQLMDMVQLQSLDLTAADSYHTLADYLDQLEQQAGICLSRLFYLSIPPTAYGPVVDLLGEAGLHRSCHHGQPSRLMVEKPFGYDLESATELITRLTRNFHEDQIYRIDHYLAKETAQNLLVFRNANPVFSAVWNRHHTKAITITSSETIGIEGRAAFYDPVGALRDVVQNHLLQLLALVTMEPPAGRSPAALHAAKLRLLEDIVPIPADQVMRQTQRGQYSGYKRDAANPTSTTETFARLELTIANDRWRGVPVIIQNGKALDRKTTEIEFTFADSGLPEAGTNRLVFRLQPDEGIAVDLLAKRPGFADQTDTVSMDFAYASSFAGHTQPTAYERVLLDGLKGDQSLFATSAEILASWKIIDNVISEWAKTAKDLHTYDHGSAPHSIGKQRSK